MLTESGSLNEEGAVYLPGFGWIPYRFYFKKAKRISVGSEYFDTALS